MKPLFTSLLAATIGAGAAFASEDIADQYPQSELYSKPVEVIPHVFSAIGATAPPTSARSDATRCSLVFLSAGASCAASIDLELACCEELADIGVSTPPWTAPQPAAIESHTSSTCTSCTTHNTHWTQKMKRHSLMTAPSTKQPVMSGWLKKNSVSEHTAARNAFTKRGSQRVRVAA